jgi:hypothetical protein
VRRVNVEMSGTVTVSVYGDFSDTPNFIQEVSTTLDVDPFWEGGPWEGGPWERINDTDLKRVRPESRARYHALKFSNEKLDESFKIYAAEMAVRGGKEH